MPSCVRCGAWVAESERDCPRCGWDRYSPVGPSTKSPRQPSPLRVLIAVVVAAIGLTVAATGILHKDSAERRTSTTVAFPTTTAPLPTRPIEGDTEALVACRRFDAFVGDTRAGIVASYEVRGRVREVYDKAKYAVTERIVVAGRDLLASATTGTPAPVAAVDEFAQACLDLGYRSGSD